MSNRIIRWIGTALTIATLAIGGITLGSVVAPTPTAAAGLCDFANCRVGSCNSNTLEESNCEDGDAYCETEDCFEEHE